MDAVLYNALSKKDTALSQYFGWAGSNFPYNSGAADIIISGPTTWNDAVGYKKVGKLTINAGQTLTIQKSPFYIFADEVNFGDATSTIDASGLAGSATPTVFPSSMASGGLCTPALAQGGGGGGMLFIICNRITGANGVIKANGGNGYRSVTGANGTGSGQGALSSTINGAAESFNYLIGPVSNNIAAFMATVPFSTTKILGSGGNAAIGTTPGIGGGSGGSGATGSGGAGSGIGGGGAIYAAGAGGNGLPAVIAPMPLDLLTLASLKCLGGGGGGAGSTTTGTTNGAGGGGGGSVVVWTHTATATPTLQANGGTGVGGTSGTANGGAGVAYLVVL